MYLAPTCTPRGHLWPTMNPRTEDTVETKQEDMQFEYQPILTPRAKNKRGNRSFAEYTSEWQLSRELKIKQTREQKEEREKQLEQQQLRKHPVCNKNTDKLVERRRRRLRRQMNSKKEEEQKESDFTPQIDKFSREIAVTRSRASSQAEIDLWVKKNSVPKHFVNEELSKPRTLDIHDFLDMHKQRRQERIDKRKALQVSRSQEQPLNRFVVNYAKNTKSSKQRQQLVRKEKVAKCDPLPHKYFTFVNRTADYAKRKTAWLETQQMNKIEQELSECTFHPKINPAPKKQLQHQIHQAGYFYERAKKDLQRKKEFVETQQRQKIEKELQECTFHPVINNSNTAVKEYSHNCASCKQIRKQQMLMRKSMDYNSKPTATKLSRQKTKWPMILKYTRKKELDAIETDERESKSVQHAVEQFFDNIGNTSFGNLVNVNIQMQKQQEKLSLAENQAIQSEIQQVLQGISYMMY